MPLERSHVIILCSVSPILIGLTAYYWYRSRLLHIKAITAPVKEQAIIDNENKVIGEESDTTTLTGIIRTEEQQGENMTIQQSEEQSHQYLANSSGSMSNDQPIMNHSKAECQPLSSTPVESVCPESDSHNQSFQAASPGSVDLSNEDTCQNIGNFSDTHTEVSADSGVGINQDCLVFRFDFPSDLVGLLIGNHGRNVKQLQEKSGARVKIERSTNINSRLQVCVVEGTSSSVDVALELIRDKFPGLDFSQLSGESSPTDQNGGAVPIPQLRIPQHTLSDVCISNIVSAGHVYLQQPTHPYFRELELLTQQMNACYSDCGAPALPEQIPVGVICAAPWIDQMTFCRSLILSVDDAAGSCLVRYVDHGSSVEMPLYNLRQIRSDFLRLPFQATECRLWNVEPVEGQEEFSAEALQFLQKVTEGCVLLCWVHGYAEDSKPLVELYLRHGQQKVSVNKLLVDNGYCRKSDKLGGDST